MENISASYSSVNYPAGVRRKEGSKKKTLCVRRTLPFWWRNQRNAKTPRHMAV